MQFRKLALPVLAASFAAGAADAQTIGIGSTKGSIVAAMTTAISKMVNQKTDLKMRRQVMGGTQKYIPVVDAGEVEFGLSNIVQYTMAKEGRDLSKKPYDNLQLAATLVRFHTGLLVRNDTDIRKIEDLKGKRLASGFKGAPLFQNLFSGFLTNAGLTWDDVRQVPAVGLRQHWNLFKQGKIDVAIAGVGGGPNKDMNAKIPSGVRYISLNTGTPNAMKAVERLRGGEYTLVQKKKAYVAIKEPAVLLGYDFMLFTNKNAPADVVYKVTKALAASEKELRAVSPVWASFSPARMPRDQRLAYHAGAMKYYKEAGLWKR